MRAKRIVGSVEERFWPKVNKDGPGGCWIWTASLNSCGYGQLAGPDHRPLAAHRLAYEFTVGEIPPGMWIDHICRVRACVNPGHLRLATAALNSQNLGVSRGTSRYRGVSPHRGKWQAQVRVDGRNYYLGVYADEDQAGVVASEFRRRHMPYSARDSK